MLLHHIAHGFFVALFLVGVWLVLSAITTAPRIEQTQTRDQDDE